MSRDDARLTFRWTKLDGTVERTLEHTMPDDHHFFWFSSNMNGDYGLLVTQRTVSEAPLVELAFPHVIDWATGATLDLVERVQPLDPEGVCERATWSWRWPRWRADGRAVYLTCTVTEYPEGGRVFDEATFAITLDGEATRLGDACTGMVVPTDDGRAVLFTGPTCDDRRHVLEPGGALDLEAREVVHTWHDGGVVVSTVTEIDGEERHDRLRWVAPDGRTEIWADTLPPRTRLLPLSRAGELPIVFGEMVHVVDSVSIRRTDGTWLRTALPSCPSFARRLGNARWNADGSAFTASCDDGDWVVRADGGAVMLRRPGSGRSGVHWSPGGELVLMSNTMWSVNDARTGQIVRLELFRELEPSFVRWDREPWTPQCPAVACR